MKLCVFGSRTIKDERVAVSIARFLEVNPGYDTIVTAYEPDGVCRQAQLCARRLSLVLELHFLNIAKRARGAFHWRSKACIEASDFVLLIHDGTSKGTANEYALTKKIGKPHQYEIMPPTPKDEAVMGDLPGIDDISDLVVL
jgi:hypothetical protein